MKAKAYYPNKLSKLSRSEYTIFTTLYFIDSFPELPKNVVKFVVGKIIEHVSDTITSPFSISEKELSKEHQLIKIGMMRDALNVNYDNPTDKDQRLSSWCGILCGYRQNGSAAIELIKYQIMTYSKLEYPVQQEAELLRLAKDATAKCVIEVCQATELEINRLQSSSSWTEKVSAKRPSEAASDNSEPDKSLKRHKR